MKNVLGNVRYWVPGTLAAFAGVLLARVIAPHATTLRLPLTIAGQLLAVAGLGIICLGVSRRVHREDESAEG